MYRRLRVWLVGGCLLILAAGAYRYWLEGGFDQPVQALADIQEVARVERGNITLVVSASGVISPAERLPLFFVLPGPVAEILVHEGDAVRAGQVLARLEAQSLELAVRDAELALQLQQVALDALTAEPREVDLEAARAAVYAAGAQVVLAQQPPDARMEQIAQLQVEIARSQLWQAQIQRDQARLTANFGLTTGSQAAQAEAGVSRAEYEVAIAEEQLAQVQNAAPNAANIAAAQAALVSAQAALEQLLDGASERDLEIADARLQAAALAVELARYQLSRATLTAPFAGVVARQNLIVGESPPASAPAIELIDVSSYYIDLAVDEIDIAQIRLGQRATINLDALPDRPLSGRVTRIDDVAVALGELVTYRVRVTLDATDVPVRVGMSATATIVVDEVPDAIRVRNRYIRLDRRTGQAFVMLRRPDGALEEVEVRLGRRNETYSEITDGLNVGDEIVLMPRGFFDQFGSFGP